MEGSSAGGLPFELSRFVGREREKSEVAPLVVANRLVTLTGPGGAGKTRLAFEVAARLAPEFAEGVRVVELASLAEPALVMDAVAQSLGLLDRSGRIALDRLAAYLEERELLLILDNCEHLIDACARFAEVLLRRCCLDLRILATSREPLGIAGEVVWRVPPLATPPPATADLAQLSNYDAVHLFVERAGAASPAFALTGENAATVVEICRRLDGMPLAIELAAAQMRILTPQQIVARLGAALDLLGGGHGSVPRHRAMRAAIDWSYRLLDEPTAAALRRFSVFQGGWELDAASEINGVSAFGALELLGPLIDKSLVMAEPDSGEMRYRMLETIRQYAAERLEESGEAEAVREWHLAYYLHIAGAATRALRSPRLPDMLHALDCDQDNLRAALTYALSRAKESPLHAEQALRLANGLEMYWRIRSSFTEGRDWLTRALAAPRNHEPSALRAEGLMHVGMLTLFQAGLDAATPALEESVALWERLSPPDDAGLAAALWRIAHARLNAGFAGEARALLTRALALFWKVQDHHGQADALWLLGRSWLGFDDERAEQLLLDSIAMYEQLGDAFMVERPRLELAQLSASRRDFVTARAGFEQCLASARRQGHRFGESAALSGLGWSARMSGDMAAASAYLSAAAELSRALGSPSDTEEIGMGYVLLAQGRPQDALGLFAAAADYARRTGDDNNLSAAIVGLAQVRCEAGHFEAATQLLGAAEAVSERAGVKIHWSDAPDWDRCAQEVRGRLSAPALEAAWNEGKRISVERAFALGSAEIAPSAPGAPSSRLPTTSQAAKARYGGLTAREREVAKCVACGNSNREIANELVLSERTVEAHIGNILGKLNLSSRTRIATWALEMGLAAGEPRANREL